MERAAASFAICGAADALRNTDLRFRLLLAGADAGQRVRGEGDIWWAEFAVRR